MIRIAVPTLVAAAGLCYFVVSSVCGMWLPSSNEMNRQALNSLFQNIEIGDVDTAVSEKFDRLRTPYLTLRKSSRCWLVSIPPEPLLTNWELHIEFRDGTVSRAAIDRAGGSSFSPIIEKGNVTKPRCWE